MTRKLKLLYAIAPILVLSVGMGCKGCKKKVDVTDTDTQPPVVSTPTDTTTPTTTTTPVSATPIEQTPDQRGKELYIGPSEAGNPTKVIFFDYDKYGIRGDQGARVEFNADWLKKNPEYQIRIEGHCDERGTEEYNVGLGDRRARSVKKQLIYLGVDPGRLFTVSYGEMRPSDAGHTDESWAKNRRVELWISSQK